MAHVVWSIVWAVLYGPVIYGIMILRIFWILNPNITAPFKIRNIRENIRRKYRGGNRFLIFNIIFKSFWRLPVRSLGISSGSSGDERGFHGRTAARSWIFISCCSVCWFRKGLSDLRSFRILKWFCSFYILFYAVFDTNWNFRSSLIGTTDFCLLPSNRWLRNFRRHLSDHWYRNHQWCTFSAL